MEIKKYDLICVGGGIMSATLSVLLKTLDPSLKVLVLERLDNVAQESSAAWNNAGTGHSALCELNYTPKDKNGNVDISKAIKICEQFEISKQFWSFLVNENLVKDPSSFITKVPHHSWVYGKENADYLEKRYEVMKEHYMFDTIEFTKDIKKMKEWFPLIMEKRDGNEPMAASRIERGTEVNFEALTKHFFNILKTQYNTKVQFGKEVVDVDVNSSADWCVKVKNVSTEAISRLQAEHVFIGAGGGSLLLLEKIEIPEKDGYGGFPISGEWLVCKNEEVIQQHNAKVYSLAGVGDPPMSVPHLDTRYINGKRELLFGPFAGFTTKFLKQGSSLDLIHSIKRKNLRSMWGVFWHNLPLTRYLIEQVAMSFEDRMNALRIFVKDARNEDWEILVAGKRVQTIKKDEFEGGQLEFGTEIVSSTCGKITCLLGASPGASTSVPIMMKVIEKAFPRVLASEKGQEVMGRMIPSWGKPLSKESFNTHLKNSEKVLQL
ncbi:malate dehydrogenase (quinone) [Flagellimonas sp. CMM7]|uniref:malate dehydrogenase (quinone) n=1 Tax=Flagellimonas sp. CMM7 TaxID=2654676 RepID=UPI0013D451EA|nr:malate dehydrogenase (quinone) [Flagellimonas sp. CMM7]UII80346.1 malate dehydrogenase (quinone) [Flagellimonas sp. CMM7]